MMQLALHSKGPDVTSWQQALAAKGFRIDVDGVFGQQTHNATLALQAAARIPTTGVVGDAERAALEQSWPNAPPPTLQEAIPLIECKYWSRGITRATVDHIVLHCMEAQETAATAENCAHYLATLSPNEKPRSAHYMVDSDSVVQGVLDQHVAWHAPGANKTGIGIEHAGFARETKAEWLDEFGYRMLGLSADLSARLCKRWSIPPVFVSAGELLLGRRGITTHVEVTQAWHRSDHTDPGPQFPVSWYLARVDAALRLQV